MEDSENIKSCKLLFWYSIFSCNFAALSAGILTTWTSPVLSKLIHIKRLKENPIGRVIYVIEESWIVSSLGLGAILGPLFGGFLSEKIGRKWTLIGFVGTPFVTSFLILAFAESTFVYYVARFIGGIGIGNLFTVLPIYLGEIGQSTIRGGVISSTNIFISLGEMFALSVGPYVSIKSFSLLCIIFPGLFLILFIFAPESPYFYLIQGFFEKAEKTMIQLHGDLIPNSEFSSARTSVILINDMDQEQIVREIWWSKGYRKALLTCFGLVSFQQLCGIYAIRSYITIIFEATGTKFSPDLSAVIVSGVQVIASLLTPFIVDVVGRKTLLLTSAIGMCSSELLLGVYFYMNDKRIKEETAWGWGPFVLLIIYIVSYNLGFRPLPWTIVGEVFPVTMRSVSSMATAMVYWIFYFVVTNLFPVVIKAAGMGPTFWILSIMCVFAGAFSKFYLIETKGKTFDEIQEELNK